MISFLTKQNCLYSAAIILTIAAISSVYIFKFSVSGFGNVRDNIVPHRALYEIKMDSARSGSQVINVSGKILYEGQITCKAWKTSQKFDVRYEYVDNKPHQITNSFAMFEAVDGGKFDFTSKRKLNGTLSKQIRGHAYKGGSNGGYVEFNAPEKLKLELPEGALFPMGHTLAVLEHIRAGDNFFKSVLFDGGDINGAVEVSTFIGERVNVEFERSAGLDASLLGSPAHHIRLAFFSITQPASIPDYEISMIFHENGVISDMRLEYQDFSVSQKLVALERLEGLCSLEK